MNAGYSLGAFVVIVWRLAVGLFRWACFLLLVLITFWMWTDDGTHPETRAWVSRNIFTPVVENHHQTCRGMVRGVVHTEGRGVMTKAMPKRTGALA